MDCKRRNAFVGAGSSCLHPVPPPIELSGSVVFPRASVIASGCPQHGQPNIGLCIIDSMLELGLPEHLRTFFCGPGWRGVEELLFGSEQIHVIAETDWCFETGLVVTWKSQSLAEFAGVASRMDDPSMNQLADAMLRLSLFSPVSATVYCHVINPCVLYEKDYQHFRQTARRVIERVLRSFEESEFLCRPDAALKQLYYTDVYRVLF